MNEIIVGIILLALCAVVSIVYPKVRDAYILSFSVQRLHWIKANMNADFFTSLESKLIDEKYFILNQDEPYIKKIIAQFIDYMEHLSLRKNIPYRKEFQMISVEEYAIWFLVCFLEMNDDSPKDEIAEYLSQDEHYISYSLTDYGYAYYRMLNIAVAYCEENSRILKYVRNPSGRGGYNIQKILDSGAVKYIR